MTTPLELVSVKYCVSGLPASEAEVVSATTPEVKAKAERVARRIEARIVNERWVSNGKTS